VSRTILAGEALGHRLMRAGAKEDVIKYLAAADVPAARRRRWYREWCRATLSKLRTEDLDRCAPGKPRVKQRGLFVDSSE